MKTNPPDLRLVFLFRTDLTSAEDLSFLEQGVERSSLTLASQKESRYSCRYELQPDFQLADPSMALLELLENWSTGSFYVDLEKRFIEDISQRRLAEAKRLLDTYGANLKHRCLLFRGNPISAEVLQAELQKWKDDANRAFLKMFEILRTQKPSGWALIDAAMYAQGGRHYLVPGSRVIDVFASRQEAESAAFASAGLCYILDIVSGQTFSQLKEE